MFLMHRRLVFHPSVIQDIVVVLKWVYKMLRYFLIDRSLSHHVKPNHLMFFLMFFHWGSGAGFSVSRPQFMGAMGIAR